MPTTQAFKNIGDAYRTPSLLSIPYFEGDNWPDIIEDILKLDNRQRADEQKDADMKDLAEREQRKFWVGVGRGGGGECAGRARISRCGLCRRAFVHLIGCTCEHATETC
jgi:hypothetical protein